MFLILRALFGIGMGGEWGVGASLAMEAAPPRWRGILSGILQSGYSIGYLLAAIGARFLLPAWGWRPMFWIGALPALLALYIRTKVPESEAWKQHRAASTGQVLRIVAKEWKRFAYLVVLMTFMMFLSHGTQDLYPDFLKEVHKISAAMVANIAMIYNVGAVVGASQEVSPGALVEEPMQPGLGFQVEGYCSDCTRTYATGAVDEKAASVYRLVQEAQGAALAQARAGIGRRELDGVARSIIAEGGHGDEFGHGLGHGVGLEVHEEPTLTVRAEGELVAGNAVTIEPGVYVTGRFGVRIEDLVVITADGREVLTPTSKELTVVG